MLDDGEHLGQRDLRARRTPPSAQQLPSQDREEALLDPIPKAG